MASTHTSVYAPTLLTKTRFAAEEDAQNIYWMITEPMAKTFRVESVDALVYLIKNSVMAICQLDHQEGIVGFLALKDHPLIPSVEPSAWESYLWTKYKSIDLNARNTLFIHLLCWNPIYGRDVVDKLLRSVFMHDPYLHHIAMLKMVNKYPLLVPGQTRAEISFRYVQAVEKGVPGDHMPVLCVADRTELCPRLRVRRAVEEDNDDIIPILDRHAPKLVEMYGEYYVSELISRHPDSERVVLVCEEQGYAVGVIVLNTQINYDELEQSFELSPFSGLRYSEHEHAHQSVNSESIANLMDNIGADSTIQFDDMLTTTKRDKSKVFWLADVDVTRAGSLTGVEPETPHERQKTVSLSPFMSTMEVLNMLDEDEEDLEYDIVNIDTTLLRVPQMLSTEMDGLTESFVKLVDESNMNEFAEDAAFIKVKKSSSKILSLPSAPEPIRYEGRPNAFVLELFAIHSDYDERVGFDILEVAYEMFPDRDYCVICLPSNHPPFPLLEHFTLVTPLSTKLRFTKETLYVAHVNSVRGEVRVRKSEPYDLPAVNMLLDNAPRKEPWMDLYKASLQSNTYTPLVLLSENQPVGVVVLGPLEDASQVRSQYELETDSLHPGNDAAVFVGVVSPIFEPHARWFMRDVLRHTRYTSLFWTSRLIAKGELSPTRNLMSLAGRMTPVRPRRMIPDLSGTYYGNDPCRESFVKSSTSMYALWSLDLPLTSLPKVDVNNSIVVVGASRTGLAFIEALILGPASTYLTFTNITLVSEHGLPSVPECLRAADTCVPRDGRYTDKYLKRLPFYFYIDVMSAVMVKIDRQRKCIHLKCGTIKFYDTLVLTCGKQFQHPEYLNDSLRLAKELQAGAPCIRLLMDDPNYEPDAVQMTPDLPENVMVINSVYQANESLRVFMRMIHEFKDQPNKLSPENRVVIYGDRIEAYSCMSALLELGLGPELLIFVEPYPPTEGDMRVNCFNDDTIDERVQASMKSLEIRVFRHSRLVGWRLRDERVAYVRLVTRMHAYQLRAFALFYYGTRDIDLHTFKAINECGLVYDGGLIIGPKFETNDPDIFGAGTCTRYSRRLYADKHMHRHYCSEDVGEELATMFLSHLDPFTTVSDEEDEDVLPSYSNTLVSFLHSHLSIPKLPSLFAMMPQLTGWEPVTRFKSPIVLYAEFPGPLYYMKLRAPGPEIPMAVALTLPHRGHTLQTDKYGDLFRLHLNNLHVINGATCLSTKPFFMELVALLYGKHESFFGQLLARYKMHMIDDLYAYFSQPWMSAVYHEPFDDMIDDLQMEEVVLGNQRFGNFHQVVNRIVADTELEDFWSQSKDRTSVFGEAIATECGQSATTRKDVASAWNAMGGEDRVTSHLARYLHGQLNTVNNQHYAKPNTAYFA